MRDDNQVYVVLRMEEFISLANGYERMRVLNAFVMGVIHEEVGTEKAFTFWRAFGRDRHT